MQPAGAPPAPSAQAGREGNQSGRSSSRSQQGQQASGAAGTAGNANSQQGSRGGNGQQGLKRAHGTATLLLAVPMEDRVIGTANAGQVSSTTQNAAPRPMRTAPFAAGVRGDGRADSGEIGHRQRTAQEEHMLERYFRRAGTDE